MDKLPKKIQNCPIVEAVIELRFSTILPSEAVFGIIYEKVKSELQEYDKLPILQIPEAVRNQDPNLMYQAHYSLYNKNNSIRLTIGPRAISFINTNKYVGWDNYISFIKNIFDKIKDAEVVNIPERIGVRYISHFDYEILDKINVNLELNGEKLEHGSTNIRTELVDNGYIKVIQIANNVQVNINGVQKTGALIDIDCIYNFNDQKDKTFNDFENIIKQGHLMEKETFFELLKEDFLKSLNPEY